MKIAVLVENTAISTDFEGEHGLSLYIEFENHRLLFDMGKTDLFLKNAEKMGIDLGKVDYAFVSHGHNDHGGGLPTFLEINKNAPVYVSPRYFEKHFNRLGKDISAPTVPLDRIRFVGEEKEIFDGATLYPTLKIQSEPILDGNMTAIHLGKREKEDFSHEQYLLLREKGKTVLFSSCSHRGAYNIARNFMPDVFVGGFHFKDFGTETEEEQQFLLEKGKQLDELPTFYYTCHCTGLSQYALLKKSMKKLDYLSTGRILEL